MEKKIYLKQMFYLSKTNCFNILDDWNTLFETKQNPEYFGVFKNIIFVFIWTNSSF